MPITPLPTPPSRTDSVNFAARSDALFTALPTFVLEANALQVTTNAQTAANEAASQAAAVAAGVARDKALAAWSASTAPAEQLASFSPSIHVGAIVKAIIYDTSKDSDGGAWRKRMQDKSWYTETLGGDRWIGQQSTIAAAWTAAGSTTGAVFLASTTAGPITIGKYYAATSATTATEVTRGISREFPAQVAIVAEAGRVVIYDLTQASCPMWMVLIQTVNSDITDIWRAGRNALALAAKEGVLLIGLDSSTGVGGLIDIRFLNDSCARHITGVSFGVSGRKVADRNLVAPIPGKGIYTLVNGTINDIAITVLDIAPTDPATGLPVPTIFVGTAGGVSVIRDTGAVESTASTAVAKVLIDKTHFRAIAQTRISCALPISSTLPAGGASHLNAYWTALVYFEGSIPAISGLTTTGAWVSGASGNTSALTLLKENPTTPTKGMVAYITNAYSSGWQVGDSRLAALADTVAETITASGELVVNGGFSTSSDWTLTGASITGGALVLDGVTNLLNGTVVATPSVVVPAVIGRSYVVSFDVTTNISIGSVSVSFGGALGTARSSVGSYRETLVAISTNSINFQTRSVDGARTGAIDNISIKLAEPDRSVKNTGLIVNGTLTKTAVASGAGLVAYSGFSASNYLEQPYSANLDFGTGDAGRFTWIKFAATAAKEVIWCRDSATTGVLSRLQVDVTTSFLSFTMFDGTTTRTATGTVAIDDGNWHLVETRYSAGTLTILVDGVSYATATGAALLTMNNATAVFRVGVDCQSANPALSGSISILRVSATVASNDQSQHIYRTELPLFQANAQCTIAGTSTAVTALAYDDVADTLQVGNSWGRTSFRDLLRIDSEATSTGAITSLSANEGVVLTGGASSGKVYAPAMYLRDELRRKDVARKALGRVPAFFDYTATASQTAFVAPKGFTIKALYKNGTLMRETTTGVYWARSNDGFQETATLSVGASVSDWVSIMCMRV